MYNVLSRYEWPMLTMDINMSSARSNVVVMAVTNRPNSMQVELAWSWWLLCSNIIVMAMTNHPNSMQLVELTWSWWLPHLNIIAICVANY